MITDLYKINIFDYKILNNHLTKYFETFWMENKAINIKYNLCNKQNYNLFINRNSLKNDKDIKSIK